MQCGGATQKFDESTPVGHAAPLGSISNRYVEISRQAEAAAAAAAAVPKARGKRKLQRQGFSGGLPF